MSTVPARRRRRGKCPLRMELTGGAVAEERWQMARPALAELMLAGLERALAGGRLVQVETEEALWVMRPQDLEMGLGMLGIEGSTAINEAAALSGN